MQTGTESVRPVTVDAFSSKNVVNHVTMHIG